MELEFYKNISKNITELIGKQKYEEALKECNKEYCQGNLFILSQKISVLMKLNRYEEALNECKDEDCKKNLAIIHQKISILKNLNRYEEALNECNKEYCKENSVIISQKISILIKLERYKEALAECNRDICKNYQHIKKQKMAILKKQLTIKAFTNQSIQVDNYLTKIYFDDISISELNSLDLTNFKNILLNLVYYEKNGKKNGLYFLKTLNQDNFSETERKALNKIKEKLATNKKQIVDFDYYCKLLKCTINFAYSPKKTVEPVKKEVKVKLESKPETPKPQVKSKPKKKFVSVKGTLVNRYTNEKSSTITKEKTPKELLLQDLFPTQILEIKKYIYARISRERSKETIETWDKFEILITKKATDTAAKNHLLDIIEVFKLYQENAYIPKNLSRTLKQNNY